MSEEALQIAEKRREVKGERERQRYTKFIAALQRMAKKDKKVFISEQCKEIEAIEQERLEISLRKLEIPREHFMHDRHNKGQKWQIHNRSRRD